MVKVVRKGGEKVDAEISTDFLKTLFIRGMGEWDGLALDLHVPYSVIRYLISNKKDRKLILNVNEVEFKHL